MCWGETLECRNSHYKEKLRARSPGDSRSRLGAALCTAAAALPRGWLGEGPLLAAEDCLDGRLAGNRLLCISGGGALVKYDCCDRHNQCLDSLGNLQILQLSERTWCAAQLLVVTEICISRSFFPVLFKACLSQQSNTA